jgi:hypothetical protein
MGAFKINRAEKPLLAHLARGGSPQDDIGRTHIAHFAHTVATDSSTAPVLARHGIGEAEVAMLYREVLQALMPDPWMNVSGPILVPTQWFMEPHRLDDILRPYAASGGQMAGVIEYAIVLARQTQQAHHQEYGEPNVQRLQKGGSSGGCASVVVLTILGSWLVALS